MTPAFSYRDALGYLGRRRRLGMKLGLERMEALAARLGSPQNKLRFIHIAGTNGKGSTAAFCAAALRRHNLKTGLFTSPHLASVRERVQVDGAPISREDFAAGITAVAEAAAGLPGDLGEPTFFEAVTALALWHFARESVAWVAWETGLGGRLDSTNIVFPAVSVITNIGLDHREFLGETVEEIAAEKAGIIKPGVTAVTATEGEALEVIRRIAAEKGAPLVIAGKWTGPALGLQGAHQEGNAACAAAALRAAGLAIPGVEIAEAFASASWPGRFQVLQKKPLLVVDGGHNAEGIAAAAAAWRALAPGPCHLVFGSLADKDHAAAVGLLASLASRITLVPPASDRAADPRSLAPLFTHTGVAVRIAGSLAEVWPSLLASEEPALVIGSLTLAGEALRLHGLLPADEGDLNELLSPALR